MKILCKFRKEMFALLCNRKIQKLLSRKYYSTLQYFYFHPSFSDNSEINLIENSFKVIGDFINESEEFKLQIEADLAVKRLKYEADHWDAAIIGYRETEKREWNTENNQILERVRKVAFPGGNTMPLVHILDLKADGVIKPHVDSVKFCGSTIAGLSILSDAVMRLVKEENPNFMVDVFLPRRSLYIMSGVSRYKYTHAVLGPDESKFGELEVKKNRRISIICRNDP